MPPIDSPPELSSLDPADPAFAVTAVDALLPMAIQRGASDVHLQPRESGWEVWLRVDGVLTRVGFLEGGGSSDPVSRLMVLAGLPTYRSSQPMEGRLRWNQTPHANEVSMRLGVFPTVHGARAVIRLLRHHSTHETIAKLGLDESAQRTLRDLCSQTDGAVLLAGPAGSGKTTSMYAMLREIAGRTPRRSVMTIEDPVETVVESISQSEVDANGGMTLASALRSAVRQDSEVLLVSEIRDPETAEAAMQASLTGHLVFSSLHAADVASALRRMVQLGVPQFVINSGVRAIIAQRLLRKICPECPEASRAPGKNLAAQESPERNDVGNDCSDCGGIGYRGRVAVAQIVRFDGADPVGDAIMNSLEAGASLTAIRQAAAAAGGIDLSVQASELVRQGLTDQDEVYRVLGRASEPPVKIE